VLQVPKLDDLDYQKLFERARGMIPTMTSEWTDFNDHDPGITTLQTFAWLYDTMNYYIGATGEVHKLKYLKLLGITPEQSPARCFLSVSAPAGSRILLPRGTKLKAGDFTFETPETYVSVANELTAVYGETGGKKVDLTMLAGKDGSFAQIFTLDPAEESAVYFGFAGEMSGNTSMYVETAPNGRNDFGDGFSLSRLEWSYWDGSDWNVVDSVQDETCGFLRSGFVSLSLEGRTAPLKRRGFKSAHYLRCRLLENQYDARPKVGRVLPNCAFAVQRNTYADAFLAVADGTDTVKLDNWFGGDVSVSAALERDGVFTVVYDEEGQMADGCSLVSGDEPWSRALKFESGREPENGARLLIMTVAPAAAEAVHVGVTDGTAGQKMALDASHVSDIRLALCGRDGDALTMEMWDAVEDLQNAGPDDKVFTYSDGASEITFGDGIHGVEPEPGLEVRAVVVRTSSYGDGNVMADRVTEFAEGSFPFTVSNPAPAFGGCHRKTSGELEALVEDKLTALTRAVNAEDYRRLVMATPGLMIDSVAVISMREYCEYYNVPFAPNTVIVAVKPTSAENCPALSATYKQIIEDNLERYRLLSTDIRVVSARYDGIGVYCRIHLRDNTDAAKNDIEGVIRDAVETVKTGEFGKKVDYGRLFSALEMLDCVGSVSQLSLEYIGAGAKKNDNGDIVVFPDSLCYLKELGIEYV